MTIDLVSLANVVALLGCVFLLAFWLIVSRKPGGLFYTIAGCATIIVAARSDRQPIHLIGIFIAAVLIVGLLVASKAVIAARRAHPRYQVYRPSPQRRRVVVAEKQRVR